MRKEEELARIRRAARDRVDYTRELDVDRMPSLSYADVDGCSSLFVYAWSEDRAEAMTISANTELLQASNEPRTFDLTRSWSGLEVAVYMYGRPRYRLPFCTDVDDGDRSEEIWRAVAGTVTIALVPARPRPDERTRHRTTIRLDGAEFVSGSGARVRQRAPLTFAAPVGRIRG